MENSPDTPVETTPQASSPKPQPTRPPFNPLLILIAVLCIGAAGGLFAYKQLSSSSEGQVTIASLAATSPTDQPAPSTPPTETGSVKSDELHFEPIKNSGATAFGFTLNNKAYVISTDPTKAQVTPLTDGSGLSTPTVSIGETGIATALNGSAVAYITQDHRVGLISADQKQKITLSEKLNVSAVGPWSPDSKRLIVYSNPGTITALYEAYPPQEKQTFKKGLLPRGYYLIDVSTGTVTPLTPLSSFNGWIDQSKILTSYSESNFDNKSLQVFNVDTFTYEPTNLLGDESKYFSFQKTVSADGKKWAFTTWGSGKDISELSTYIADFPQLSGTLIGKGSYIQDPRISPDGKKVMYQNRDIQNGPLFTEVWENNQVTRVGQGMPIAWKNDTQLIYSEMNPELSSNTTNHLRTVYLYDLQSKLKTELFPLTQ